MPGPMFCKFVCIFLILCWACFALLELQVHSWLNKLSRKERNIYQKTFFYWKAFFILDWIWNTRPVLKQNLHILSSLFTKLNVFHYITKHSRGKFSSTCPKEFLSNKSEHPARNLILKLRNIAFNFPYFSGNSLHSSLSPYTHTYTLHTWVVCTPQSLSRGWLSKRLSLLNLLKIRKFYKFSLVFIFTN